MSLNELIWRLHLSITTVYGWHHSNTTHYSVAGSSILCVLYFNFFGFPCNKCFHSMYLSAHTIVIVSSTARLPCFGLDIGGTLVKLVYFEPLESTTESSVQEQAGIEALREFIISNVEYGEEGFRDDVLEMNNLVIGGKRGNLHFIRFPTSHIASFLEIAARLNASVLARKVCATGGGAFKFEKDFREVSLN